MRSSMKWVFQTKTNAGCDIERYKSRTVVCGNEQSYGENSTMTFAVVMDMTTAKLSWHYGRFEACYRDMAMCQMHTPRHRRSDINNIYMVRQLSHTYSLLSETK